MNERSTAAIYRSLLLILLVCIGLMMMAACSPAVVQTTPSAAQHSAEVCLKSGPGETGPVELSLLALAGTQQAALTTSKSGFRYKP